MRVIVGIVVALICSTPAQSQSLDDWQFDIPDGAVEERAEDALIVRKDGTIFRFFKNERGNPEEILNRTIDAIVSAGSAKKRPIEISNNEDGSTIYSRTVWLADGDATKTLEIMVFDRDGQLGVMSIEMADAASVMLVGDVLPTLGFFPAIKAVSEGSTGSTVKPASLSDWIIDLPDTATEKRVADEFQVIAEGARFRFFQSTEGDAADALDALRVALFDDVATDSASVENSETDDGTPVVSELIYVLPKNGQTRKTVQLLVFERDGRLGRLAIEMTDAASVRLVSKLLPDIEFLPSVPIQTSAVSETIEVDPAFVALSRSKIDAVDAHRLKLNPDDDLLPDIFECYQTEEEGAAPRHPYGSLSVQRNGAYVWKNASGSGFGRWRRLFDDDDIEIEFRGPLVGTYSDSRTQMRYDEYGQSFKVDEANSKRELYCFQRGPKADHARLMLERARIQTGEMSCYTGKPKPLTIKFGRGFYASSAGRGRYVEQVELSSRGKWEAETVFKGGPLDGVEGTWQEDDAGNRRLDFSNVTRSSRIFSFSTKSEGVGICRSKAEAKPFAIFGQDLAPPAPTGPLSGLYTAQILKWRMGIDAMMYATFEREFFDFKTSGRVSIADPNEVKTKIDCRRTKPNGQPICPRYDIRSGRIRFESEPGGWEEWQSFRKTASAVEIDDQAYSLVAPLTGFSVDAEYRTQSSDGDDTATISSGAGFVSYANVMYQFSKNGRFVWRGSYTTNTFITPLPGMTGGAIGGGSRSKGDSGKGRYHIEKNDLILEFADGRSARYFIENGADGWRLGIPPPNNLTIDGISLDLMSP